jgi:phage gpG-like protein
MVNVGFRSNLTNAATAKLDWSYAFEPSIAITTGRIDKLGLDIRSFREPLHDAVTSVMTHSILANFDAQGRPAWEPLSEDTWRTRAAQGWGGGGILLKSGLLRKVSIQVNIWTISATSATIRDLPSKIWYGKVHQSGAGGGSPKGGGVKVLAKKGAGGITKFAGKSTENARGYVNIPQRQIFIIQKEDETEIVEIFREWLEGRVKKRMGKIG